VVGGVVEGADPGPRVNDDNELPIDNPKQVPPPTQARGRL